MNKALTEIFTLACCFALFGLGILIGYGFGSNTPTSPDPAPPPAHTIVVHHSSTLPGFHTHLTKCFYIEPDECDEY